jgi:hypothetical protein
VKIVLDEMLSARVAGQLRKRGHDAVAVVERDELRRLGDAEQFERAQQEHRALVTYDRDDYLALDRWYRQLSREHAGLVILNSHRFPPGKASTGRLVTALDRFMSAGAPYPGFIHWLA